MKKEKKCEKCGVVTNNPYFCNDCQGKIMKSINDRVKQENQSNQS